MISIIQSYFSLWHLIVLGYVILDKCASRPVNVSNTWTLPQGGFHVFYRFFQDKVSWFEADAVCQFHHANLVTVENAAQFDATRSFLEVLNVTQSVWIGLKRPLNSKTFIWSNTKLLSSSSGYWAESLPLMESPLCAVIDPVRDFRWHALRCGGPEVASFLCEINTPNWARDCILKNIPSLLIQYVADSGTVEITKNCKDGKTIQRVCRSKKDVNTIKEELTCNYSVVNTEQNFTETHFKSLQLISSIRSDNNEDNNINILPDQIKGKGNKVEETIVRSTYNKNKGEINALKQNNETERTVITRRNKSLYTFLNGMIINSQKSLETEEIQRPIPHMKKSLARDLRTRRTTESLINKNIIQLSTDKLDSNAISSSTTSPITENSSLIIGLGHPIHPYQSHASIPDAVTIGDELLKHTITKEISDSHFIPPMLLVKSHYTSTKSHFDEQSIPISVTDVDISTQSTKLISQDLSKTSPSYFKPTLRVPTFSLETNYSSILPNTSASPESDKLTLIATILPSTLDNHQRVEDVKLLDHAKSEATLSTTIAISTTVHDAIKKTTGNQDPLEILLLTPTSRSNTVNKLNSANEKIDSNKFSNEELYQPHKSNRKRILTKAETTSYLKRILG